MFNFINLFSLFNIYLHYLKKMKILNKLENFINATSGSWKALLYLNLYSYLWVTFPQTSKKYLFRWKITFSKNNFCKDKCLFSKKFKAWMALVALKGTNLGAYKTSPPYRSVSEKVTSWRQRFSRLPPQESHVAFESTDVFPIQSSRER